MPAHPADSPDARAPPPGDGPEPGALAPGPPAAAMPISRTPPITRTHPPAAAMPISRTPPITRTHPPAAAMPIISTQPISLTHPPAASMPIIRTHPLADACFAPGEHAEYTVPVSTMGKDMQPRTHMRHARMAPYARRVARFENICGQFEGKVLTECLAAAIVTTHTCFGWQRELYHTEGTVSLAGRTATFKGVRSREGIARLARAMRLPAPQSRVHMAVLSGTTGVAADVFQQGYLETQLWPWVRDGRIKVDPPFEQTNSLRLSILRFDSQDLALPEALRPASNDWTVTSRGSVVARMTWPGLGWDAAAEAALAGFADRVFALLGRACV